MKRDAANRPTRPRSRKKTDAATPPPPTVATADRNLNEMEGSVSVVAGVMLLVAALFPRTLRQLLLLGLGGGLLYRGVMGRCAVYSTLGVNTSQESLLKQINEKYLSAALDA